MSRTFGAIAFTVALTLGSASANAQAQAPATSTRVQAYYSAPGYYGTSYGFASYGMRQTYSTFSSPFGPGYAYGYPPATILPGSHGQGIWTPNVRQTWRTPYYGTYAIPSAPAGIPAPPIGVYAPGFGPGVPPYVFGSVK
jgi:hypothetical protein